MAWEEFYSELAEEYYTQEHEAKDRYEPLLSGPGPCPNCGRDMLVREGKHRKFYGCSNFPWCSGKRRYVEAFADKPPIEHFDIRVKVGIVTQGEYCGLNCRFLYSDHDLIHEHNCLLFKQGLLTKQGHKILRCNECVKRTERSK